MKYYISGPMTGIPNKNEGAFEEATTRLRAAGYEIHNPAEIDLDSVRRFGELLLCDGIVVLPGWAKSEGSKVEVALAVATGKQVFAYHQHRPQFLEKMANLKIVTRPEMLK